MEKYEIEKLRDLPIEEVAEQLGLQVVRHKALCPFHDDHHASLSFNLRKNTCRCFVCMDGAMGSIDLVMRSLHVDFVAACHWLADKNNITLGNGRNAFSHGFGYGSQGRAVGGAPSDWHPSHGLTGDSSPSDCNSASTPTFAPARYGRFFEHPWLSDAARRFLFEERKLDERVVRWCRLTSWSDREGTHWLQIPYYDIGGKLIGIQNRNLDYKKPMGTPDKQAKPRFRFPYGAKCSIYNLPVIAMLHPGEALYITEGCSDCWAMLSAGHKAIAIPSATLLTPQDKELLADLSHRLAIAWHMFPDRDAPGERLFLQLKEILPSLKHHQLPKGCKDFGEWFRRGLSALPYAPDPA